MDRRVHPDGCVAHRAPKTWARWLAWWVRGWWAAAKMYRSPTPLRAARKLKPTDAEVDAMLARPDVKERLEATLRMAGGFVHRHWPEDAADA